MFELIKKTKLSQSEGFTLIEVMVAIVIFVIAIIGCYEMQVASSSSNSKAGSIATSANWAAYFAENLINREFTAKYTDSLLKNNNGATDGSIDLNDTDKAGDTPDGVRYIGADGSVNVSAGSSHIYTAYWNVADDNPVSSVKHIRIIVIKNGGLLKGQELIVQDCFKLESL